MALFGKITGSMVEVAGGSVRVLAVDGQNGQSVWIPAGRPPIDPARYGFIIPVVDEPLADGEICDGHVPPEQATLVNGELVRAAINKRAAPVEPISVSRGYLLLALRRLTAAQMTAGLDAARLDLVQTWLNGNPGASALALVTWASENLQTFGLTAGEAEDAQTLWGTVSTIDENHASIALLGGYLGADTPAKLRLVFELAALLAADGVDTDQDVIDAKAAMVAGFTPV